MKNSNTPVDINGTPIVERSIVTICGDNRFTDKQGLVIDNASDLRPEDGPIAVFFDQEVAAYEFHLSNGYDYKAEPPPSTNYHKCPRVICFEPEEVRVCPEFKIEALIQRHFRSDWHSIYSFKFPLIPSAHACQMAQCTSGDMATTKTIINVWGGLHVVYTCSACHNEWNGRRCDGFELKKPLPGETK